MPTFVKQEQAPISRESIEVNEYIKTLTAQQLKVLDIAKDHLKSSFNIVKSIGFKEWKLKNKNL